jgi:hypothetical protein
MRVAAATTLNIRGSIALSPLTWCREKSLTRKTNMARQEDVLFAISRQSWIFQVCEIFGELQSGTRVNGSLTVSPLSADAYVPLVGLPRCSPNPPKETRMEPDDDPFEYRARKADYVESKAVTETTNLELAAFIRRLALILDPRHYGEEQKMLRLAAQRLEAQEITSLRACNADLRQALRNIVDLEANGLFVAPDAHAHECLDKARALLAKRADE